VARATFRSSQFTPARAGHAPRSLFRAAFRYLRSGPWHDRAGPRHLRSGDVHGICLTLRSVPCPRVPAFVTRPLRSVVLSGRSPPFIPTCRFRDPFRMPLIFTAVGRARLRIRQALPGEHHSRETSVTRGEPEWARSTAERSDRLLGRPTAGKPSRLDSDGCAPPARPRPANPAMGFAGLLSGVSGAFSQHAAALLRRARVVCAVRSSPRPSFRGPPSAHGFCVRLNSGDVHSFDSRRAWHAQGVSWNRQTHSRIEVRRRHPCRRRPFSVLGRPAPSRSDRFQAVTAVY